MNKHNTPSLRLLALLTMLWSVTMTRAQVCPVAAPTVFWTNQTTSGLGFPSGSTFSGAAQITGTFTVNVGLFILGGAGLTMQPGSEIIVNPGCTLRINNGSVLTAQQILWKGIRVQPGGRVEVDQSTVCAAENAIRSNAGFGAVAGSLDLRNADFLFNQVGVRLQNYTAAFYPAVITGCRFEGGSLLGASTGFSTRGVVASNVGVPGGFGLQVGELSAGSLANSFESFDVGVEGIASSLQVFNATFTDMQDINGFGEGYGVLANASSPGPHFVEVGASGIGAVGMTDCRFGVGVRNADEARVTSLTYANGGGLTERGIQMAGIQDVIAISNTDLSGFTEYGMFLDANPGFGGGTVFATVEDNVLNGTLGTSEGIWIDELDGDAWVRRNEVVNVYRAITLQNVGPEPLVEENTVLFFHPGHGVTFQPAFGVGFLNVSAGGDIRDNTITGNCPLAGAFGPCTTGVVDDRRIRGVQMTNTFDVWVDGNEIFYCGAGLYVETSNFEGNALCNYFFDCFTGTVFDALPSTGFGVAVTGGGHYVAAFDIGDHDNANNEWVSSISGYLPFRAWSINMAFADSTTWWHDPTPVIRDMPTPTVDREFGSTFLTTNVGSPNNVCFDDTGTGRRDSLETSMTMRGQLDAIESGTEALSSAPGLYTYLAKRLGSDSGNARILRVADYSNLPLLIAAQRDWHHGTIMDPTAGATPAIGPEEEAWMRAFAIRAAAQSRWLLDPDTSAFHNWTSRLTDDERTYLEALSLEAPSEFGEAVHWAQSFLNRTIIGDRWQDEAARQASQSDRYRTSSFAYPNPASNSVVLSLEQDGGDLILLDLAGRVIRQWLNVQNGQVVQWEEVPAGSYFLHYENEEGVVRTQQLVIEFFDR
jgi:hypothetical protein